MELKKQYIKERNLNKFSYQFLFEFYKEKGGTISDFNQFTQIFSMGGFNIDTDMLDTYFQLTTLHAKTDKGVLGEFIKVVKC